MNNRNPQFAALYNARKRNRKTEVVDDDQAPAWGSFAFTANPSNGHTITIGSTILTFGTTFTIGADLAATLAALLSYVLAHPIAGAEIAVSGNSISVASTAPGDNSIALASSNGNAVASAAHLQKHRINVRMPL